MRRSFLFLCLILSAALAAGQEIRLSNRFVIDIAVDAQDRVWVATEEGLNCYDGILGRSFLKSPDGLPTNQLNGVLPDREEPLLWIAMQKAGLACLDLRTERFTVYRADGAAGSLPDDDISHVEQAPDGAIWVSTFSRGMARLDKATGRFEPYTISTFEGMRDVPLHTFKFRGDQLIQGFWAGGVSILSLADHSRIDLRHVDGDPRTLPSDAVRALLVDSRGRMWVGTMDGLALYSEAGRSFTVFRHRSGDPASLPDDAVYDLAEDASGQLLVATGAGLARLDIRPGSFDPDRAAFEQLTRPGRRDRAEVRALSQDRFGNLWVGTYGDGLHFRSGREVGAGRLQTVPAGPGPHEIQALAVGADGRLLAGLYSGQLEAFPSGAAPLLPGSEEAGPILSLLQDRDGTWWVGDGSGGLYAAGGRRSGRIVLENHPQTVRALLLGGARLWVGTDKGLYAVDPVTRKVLSHWTHTDGGLLPDNLIRALLMDGAGRLWVGTFGHGLSVYGQDMAELAHYDGDTGLLSDTVNHLFLDHAGRVWVATTGGLVRFDGGPDAVSATFSAADGLPEENVRALSEDAAGNLWMSTNDGIACLRPDGRTAFFDHRDGLPDGNYYGGAVARSPQGRMWFGSTDGIGWIDPSILLGTPVPPPVAFLTPAAELSTTWRNNYLRVRFCVPDHSYAGSIEYAYRIPGLDADWHPCGTELEFHQLPYGRHTLQVRSRLHNTEWSPNVTAAELEVRPPFWLTWWAKGFYILLTLGFIAAVVLHFNRKLARKNREKLQEARLMQERQASEERMVFYTNITHELRTPLTLILGPLEDLSEDESLPVPARSRIGKVKQSAQQLLGLVNQLLEFRKTETHNRRLSVRYGDLSQFVTEVGEQFRGLASNRAVEIVLAVEPDVRLQFDAEAITIILNNLLSNAQKYTPSGKIVLSLQREGDRVAVAVSDTGCGISAADQEHLFDRYFQVKGPHQASGSGIGLALVKNLCELHHIGLSVSSELGQGSEFRLLFDPAEDYPEAIHQDPEVPAVQEEENPEETSGASGKVRILVVEDNPEILEYIRESLEPEYTVLLASQGREGLKTAIREIPDIIVSDIMMPVMDGLDMCKAIRQDVRTSHIPVILLTAKGTDEDRVEGYDVGADSYLVKPFRRALLLSRIRNLLDRRQVSMTEVSRSGSAPDLSPVDNEFLTRYTQFVEEHLGDEHIDIASLAGQFAMSQSTLYRKVKAVSGLSPNELIRNIRLNRAAELLRRQDLTIQEIAWQTGFGSPVYFRTCFKERYGMTPSEYREQK